MSQKQHVVDLSNEERRTPEWFISTGEHKAEDITRARILLKADEGLTDSTICEHLDCSVATPHRARKNYYERGLAAIHRRKPDRERKIKLDGDAEARLIKLACSEPSKGHSRWTLHLLADELVMLDEIDFESVSHETVRQRLHKTLENRISPATGKYRLVKMLTSFPAWRTCLLFPTSHLTKPVQSFVLTSQARHFVGMNAIRSRPSAPEKLLRNSIQNLVIEQLLILLCKTDDSKCFTEYQNRERSLGSIIAPNGTGNSGYTLLLNR